ncbi:hypothetical protein EIN_461980, partial [Entamoeba invadens IP1]
GNVLGQNGMTQQNNPMGLQQGNSLFGNNSTNAMGGNSLFGNTNTNTTLGQQNNIFAQQQGNSLFGNNTNNMSGLQNTGLMGQNNSLFGNTNMTNNNTLMGQNPPQIINADVVLKNFLLAKAREDYSKQELSYKEMDFDERILKRKDEVFRKACVLKRIEESARPQLEETVSSTQNQLVVIRDAKEAEKSERGITTHIITEANSKIDPIVQTFEKEFNRIKDRIEEMKTTCKPISYVVTREDAIESCFKTQGDIENVKRKIFAVDNEVESMGDKIDKTQKSRWKHIDFLN